MKCGYHLTGLPATGTVVMCPECGHATDLARPLPRLMGWFEPVFWGMVPAGLSVLAFVFEAVTGTAFGAIGLVFGAACLLVGAATAGGFTLERFVFEPARGRAPRPLWVRLALSMCAAAASLVVNAAILLAVVVVRNAIL